MGFINLFLNQKRKILRAIIQAMENDYKMLLEIEHYINSNIKKSREEIDGMLLILKKENKPVIVNNVHLKDFSDVANFFATSFGTINENHYYSEISIFPDVEITLNYHRHSFTEYVSVKVKLLDSKIFVDTCLNHQYLSNKEVDSSDYFNSEDDMEYLIYNFLCEESERNEKNRMKESIINGMRNLKSSVEYNLEIV